MDIELRHLFEALGDHASEQSERRAFLYAGIQLLFKSKDLRHKDEVDAQYVLSLLAQPTNLAWTSPAGRSSMARPTELKTTMPGYMGRSDRGDSLHPPRIKDTVLLRQTSR